MSIARKLIVYYSQALAMRDVEILQRLSELSTVCRRDSDVSHVNDQFWQVKFLPLCSGFLLALCIRLWPGPNQQLVGWRQRGSDPGQILLRHCLRTPGVQLSFVGTESLI